MPFNALLSAGRIGSMEIRNRMVATAMGLNFSDPDGHWGERILAFHEEQARGGIGLIISGVCGVMYPVGQVSERQLGLSDDKYIPGLTRVVDAVHRHGAKFAVQLHQGGLNAVDDTVAGRPLWCPSVPEISQGGDFAQGMLLSEMKAFAATGAPTHKVMTREDIDVLVRAFVDGSRRAITSGCDAVEIHGGHGYVPSSFLSPATNKRTDEYGGNLENRARLLLDIVRAVRAEVGVDFPVIVKLDSREVGRANGISLADATLTAQWLEEVGADAITVTAYHEFSQGKLHSASNIPHEPNTNLPAAASIRKALKIPVIASGRVEPKHADVQIGGGLFDFLAMGRKLLADPYLPDKIRQGKIDEVRPCVYCYTCVSAMYNREVARCAVNADCGREYQRRETVAESSKHVAVVGGGPAGMEAACRLADRGHRVTLLEKSDQFGGTLRFASIAYEANQKLLDWLRAQVAARKIDARLNTEATAELLTAMSPDDVVVATGALRSLPAIRGSHLPHVFSGDDMRDLVLGAPSDQLKSKTSTFTRVMTRVGAATGITANAAMVRKASRAWMPLGKNIVIIGGELVGIELAEFLTARGRQVTVVDEEPCFGSGLTLVRRLRVLAELREQGATLSPACKDLEIVAGAVCFIDKFGDAHRIAADQVIVAKGASGDSTQADIFRDAGLRVHEIGDGTGVGYIEGAIRDAADVVDTIHIR